MDSARFEFSADADAGIFKFDFKAREHFAKKVHRRAVRLAPVSPPNNPHSGHLRRHIVIDLDAEAHYIGADVEYAAAQELGARPHFIPHGWGHDPGVHHPGNKAQPYLRPALYIQTLIEEADF